MTAFRESGPSWKSRLVSSLPACPHSVLSSRRTALPLTARAVPEVTSGTGVGSSPARRTQLGWTTVESHLAPGLAALRAVIARMSTCSPPTPFTTLPPMILSRPTPAACCNTRTRLILWSRKIFSSRGMWFDDDDAISSAGQARCILHRICKSS